MNLTNTKFHLTNTLQLKNQKKNMFPVFWVKFPYLSSIWSNSLTFPAYSQFLDFALTGKYFPIFQVFQSMKVSWVIQGQKHKHEHFMRHSDNLFISDLF